MKVLLVMMSFIVPILMVYIRNKIPSFNKIFHILAIVAFLLVANISSISIVNIIINDQVFMTTIHGIFINPYFLISGAYLSVYILYRMLLVMIND